MSGKASVAVIGGLGAVIVVALGLLTSNGGVEQVSSQKYQTPQSIVSTQANDPATIPAVKPPPEIQIDVTLPVAESPVGPSDDVPPHLSAWFPSAPRDISPEMEAEIEKTLSDCIALLGYERVDALEFVRHVVHERDNTLPYERRSKIEYVKPSWIRKEYSRSASGQEMVEVSDGNMRFRSERGAPDSMEIFAAEPWYQYPGRHPLMLGFELNPRVYEDMKIMELTAEDAEKVRAKDAVGHRIAVLQTPVAEINHRDKITTVQYETWVDLENGRLVQFTYLINGEPIMHRIEYTYKEIEEGVHLPVSHTELQRYPEGWTGVEHISFEEISVNRQFEKQPAY